MQFDCGRSRTCRSEGPHQEVYSPHMPQPLKPSCGSPLRFIKRDRRPISCTCCTPTASNVSNPLFVCFSSRMSLSYTCMILSAVTTRHVKLLPLRLGSRVSHNINYVNPNKGRLACQSRPAELSKLRKNLYCAPISARVQ